MRLSKSFGLLALAAASVFALPTAASAQGFLLEPLLSTIIGGAVATHGSTPCDAGIPDTSCRPGQVPGSAAPSVSISFLTAAPSLLPAADWAAVWPQGDGSERVLTQQLAMRYIVVEPELSASVITASGIKDPRFANDTQRAAAMSSLCDKSGKAGNGLIFGNRNPTELSATRFRVELIAYSCAARQIVWTDQETVSSDDGLTNAVEGASTMAWANRLLQAAGPLPQRQASAR